MDFWTCLVVQATVCLLLSNHSNLDGCIVSILDRFDVIHTVCKLRLAWRLMREENAIGFRISATKLHPLMVRAGLEMTITLSSELEVMLVFKSRYHCNLQNTPGTPYYFNVISESTFFSQAGISMYWFNNCSVTAATTDTNNITISIVAATKFRASRTQQIRTTCNTEELRRTVQLGTSSEANLIRRLWGARK